MAAQWQLTKAFIVMGILGGLKQFRVCASMTNDSVWRPKIAGKYAFDVERMAVGAEHRLRHVFDHMIYYGPRFESDSSSSLSPTSFCCAAFFSAPPNFTGTLSFLSAPCIGDHRCLRTGRTLGVRTLNAKDHRTHTTGEEKRRSVVASNIGVCE